jgi:hypothetical protein
MDERNVPVEIIRQYLQPDSDMVAMVNINRAQYGRVLAVLVGNEGSNSRVKVGKDAVYKTIPDAGSLDVSYGVSWPYYFEDEIKVVFSATGASPVHCALLELIVEKTC